MHRDAYKYQPASGPHGALTRLQQDHSLSPGTPGPCTKLWSGLSSLSEPSTERWPGLCVPPGPVNHRVNCSQVSAPLPAPGATHWAVAGPHRSQLRAPSCSQVSAPLPAPQSRDDRREVSARFPAPSTDLRPGPGPVPARPCSHLLPSPRTAATATAAPRHSRLC